MKSISRLLIVYGSVGVTFFLLFVALFGTPIFSSQPILLYRGLNILWTVTAIYIAYGIYLFRSKATFTESFFSAVAVTASLTLTFFILIPVTIDRSVSTFMLSSLSQHYPSCIEGGTKTDLVTAFLNEYVVSRGAIERRLDEQSRTKTIENIDGCWRLTEKGVKTIDFFNSMPLYFGTSYENKR